MKALITYNFKDRFKKLEDLGYDIIYKSKKDLEALSDLKELEDVEVLVAFDDFDILDISKLPNLKWVQLLSTGINQVPADKILDNNITLTNNKLGYNIPIGEWIVYSILELAKNPRIFFEQQQNKIWKMDTSLTEVYGKTIGFLGTGDIAKEASKRLQGFGVNIVGINSTGNPTEYFSNCYSMKDMDKVLGDFDYLVVTLPYTPDTHHFVDGDMFSKLKDGVSIVNIARGTIIDEAEMIKNLKSGKIKNASLDVFEVEPLPKDNPLWEMDNVIVSPHNSWASEKHDERRFNIVYENMNNYINNRQLINIIDLKKGY